MRWYGLVFLCAAACGAPQSKTSTVPVAAEPLIEAPASPPTVVPEAPCDWPRAGAWPMFQQNASRTGVSAAPGIRNPTIRWSRPLGIAGWLNSPVIAEDTVFVGSNGQVWNQPDGGDGVAAFDLQTGDTRWFHALDGDVNGVAYASCRVFATTDSGKVVGLDARSGERLWVLDVKGQKFYSNPLVVGDIVLVGDSRGTAWAINARDGKAIWTRAFSGAIRGGLAADGARVYVTTESKQVAALDPKNGAVVWSTTLSDPNATQIYAAPTVLGDMLVVGYVRDTSYQQPALVAYDASSGQQAWLGSNPDGHTGGWGNIRSSPAVIDGKLVYGEPYSNRVVTVDGQTGVVTASEPIGPCMFQHWPSPAVANGMFYLPRHDGGLYAFLAGSPAWGLYLGDSARPPLPFPDEMSSDGWDRCSWDPPVGKPIYASPAIADDGTIVVATGDGFLHAVAETPE